MQSLFVGLLLISLAPAAAAQTKAHNSGRKRCGDGYILQPCLPQDHAGGRGNRLPETLAVRAGQVRRREGASWGERELSRRDVERQQVAPRRVRKAWWRGEVDVSASPGGSCAGDTGGLTTRPPLQVLPLELTAALADRHRIERELGAGGMATDAGMAADQPDVGVTEGQPPGLSN